MKSAGISRKKMGGPEIAYSDAGDDSKIYPSASVEHGAMPHMKKHSVGDTGEMHIKYKVTGQRQYRSGEGNTDFEITHYEPAKKVKGKDDDKETAAKADEEKEPKAEQK